MSAENGEKFDENLTIFRATDKDFDDIYDFLNEDFLYTESLNNSVSGTKEEFEPLFKSLVKGVEVGYSYIIRDDETKKVIAVRLTTFLERDSSHSAESSSEDPHFSSWKPAAIVKLLEALELKLWDQISSNINKLASWTVISVSSKYSRRGIALRLINHNLNELKEAGCQGIATEATAFKSQQLFVKHGYQNIYEIKHSDWKNENGQQIFKCNDSTDKAILIYKEL
uniref:N-acetyltransferase domain-containing protein n=1 Tax=Panagrolaimus sp. ES5 TaxID=591445 RepID=A0AC34GBX7_9BILA